MRHNRQGQRSIGRNLWAFLQILGHVLAPWRRPWRLRWGACPDEPSGSLPGDDIIADPAWEYTHAISIEAPPEAVWPWIVQIGQGRGGFYSFELLENLIGCNIANADRIIPEHQTLDVGDEIRLHPTGPALTVAVVEPGRSLVLRGMPAAGTAATTDSLWGFHIVEDGPGRSRFVERGKNVHGTSLTERLMFSPLLVEPIGFVMSREMLFGIKERAEATSVTE